MLALIGSGEYLPAMEPVDRYLLNHLPPDALVICLPTAAGAEGADRIAYWRDLGAQHFGRMGVRVKSLPIIDPVSANDPALIEQLRCADLIYLSGGRPDYLLSTLKGSLAWEVILDLVSRDGILAGCSAGAMIFGDRIPAFPAWKKAFNLIEGATIIPHLDEIPSYFYRTMKLFVGKGSTLVGIEGNTALVLAHEHYRVVGSGSVMVWNRTGKKLYSTGQTIILNADPQTGVSL